MGSGYYIKRDDEADEQRRRRFWGDAPLTVKRDSAQAEDDNDAPKEEVEQPPAKPCFKVAYIKEQGADMIIVPVSVTFEDKSPEEQQAIVATLEAAARSAGLIGTVVPVWDHGLGQMAFMAPKPWAPFFQNIGLEFVFRNINHELSW